jgi:hypothetical protein
VALALSPGGSDDLRVGLALLLMRVFDTAVSGRRAVSDEGYFFVFEVHASNLSLFFSLIGPVTFIPEKFSPSCFTSA